MSRGRPSLAYNASALTLANALPAVPGTTVAGDPILYDDFADVSSPTQGKWEGLFYYNGASDYPSSSIIGGTRRARSGYAGDRGGAGYPQWAAANGYLAGIYRPDAVSHVDAGLATVGEWRFTLYTESSAVNVVHCRFAPLYSAAGGYVLEISGSDMVTAKLWKTAEASLETGLIQDTNQTLVTTFTALTGHSATATIFRLTRTAGGTWELFQDGVSKGTVVDTTYTAGGSVGFTTAVYQLSVANITQATWIDDIYLPSAGTTVDVGDNTRFIAFNNRLYTAWYTAAAAFTFTELVTASRPSNIPGITHLNARGISVWSRDKQPTANKNVYLAACRGQLLRCYNGETQVFTGATTLYGTTVFPANSTTIVVVGTTTENSGVMGIEVIKFVAESWTVTTQHVITFDGGVAGRSVPTAAYDSSGNLYVGMADLSPDAGSMPSRLFIITPTDLLGSIYPTITSAHNLNDFVLRSITSLAGSIYLTGARIRGGESFATVLKYPSTVIWESSLAKEVNPGTIADSLNQGIASSWNNLDNIIFLGMNDLASWAPVLRMDVNGNVTETASFDSKQFSYTAGAILALAEWGGRFYLLNTAAGTILRTNLTRGALGSAYSYATLELSAMGANTDLITKTLYSVTLELSAAVPTGETLSVLVNDTVIGTMVPASGTKKEMVLTAELTAASFICKLRWPQASTWTGYVKNGPLLKYVPTQFKKRAWGFGIRATKRLKMGDGTHESRTPATMFTDIEAAWASNIPVTFIDVDGTTYSVLITDFKQKRPLLQINRQSEAEAFYFVELLEV